MIYVWEKYFYKQLLKSAGLFLFIFYGLYILVDYASHLSGAHYHHSKLKLYELAVHYLSEFSDRADILIPFALLISSVHTLCKLNIHSELIALLAGGYSLHRLLRPFIIIGLLAVLGLYINNESLLPKALKNISRLDAKYARQKVKNQGLTAAHPVRLENGALLIYKEFDPHLKQFQEVFFLPFPDVVWRIAILEPFASPPRGYFADQFEMIDSTLQYKNSHADIDFPDMALNEKKLTETLALPRELSLSALMKEIPSSRAAEENEKAAKSLTALYQKLALPWLCLLAVIGPAPLAIRFSRQLPVFLIFTISIFGLVGVYLMMDAAIILGERQVLPPFIAIFAPMGLLMTFFLYRYINMKTN